MSEFSNSFERDAMIEALDTARLSRWVFAALGFFFGAIVSCAVFVVVRDEQRPEDVVEFTESAESLAIDASKLAQQLRVYSRKGAP